MIKPIIPVAIAGIVIVVIIIGFVSMNSSDIILDNAFNYQSESFKESLKNAKSNNDVRYEAAEIIKERDCKQFVEWYEDNSLYVRDLSFIYELDLDSYNKYCKDPDTVLDENGIDIEERWSMYNTLSYDK